MTARRTAGRVGFGGPLRFAGGVVCFPFRLTEALMLGTVQLSGVICVRTV